MKLKKAVGIALIAYILGFLGIVSVGLAVGGEPAQLALYEAANETPGVAAGGSETPGNGPSDPTTNEQPSSDGSTTPGEAPTGNAPGASSGNSSSSTGGSTGSTSGSGGSGSSGGNTGSPTSPTPTPTPKPTPAPAPTPAPKPTPACGSGGSCSAAQVATHNTQSNCWVIYSGKVYNVSGFVSKHPGGRSVFNSNTCGKDISAYLNGSREPTSGEQYRHSSGDISDINPYFIANLG